MDLLGNSRLTGCRNFFETRPWALFVNTSNTFSESEIPSSYEALLQGLEFNLKIIRGKIAEEQDPGKKKLLETDEKNCLGCLKERQRPLKNHQDLRDAISTIGFDDIQLKTFQAGQLDFVHVNLLINSDLWPFFDPQLQGMLTDALEKARKKEQSEEIRTDVGRVVERASLQSALLQQTDSDWKKYLSDVVDPLVLKKQEERMELGQRIAQSRNQGEKSRLKRQLAEADSLLRDLAKQKEKAEPWKWKRFIALEEGGARFPVTDFVPQNVKERTPFLVEEARFMKFEKIREYLNSKLKKFKEAFGQSKSLLAADQQKDVEEQIALFESVIASRETILKALEHRNKNPKNVPMTEAEYLELLEGNLDHALLELNCVAKAIEERNEAKPNNQQEIQREYTEFMKTIEGVKGSDVDLLIETLEKSEVQRQAKAPDSEYTEKKFFEENGDYRKKRDSLYALKTLKDTSAEWAKKISEMKPEDREKVLLIKEETGKFGERVKNIGAMEPEEMEILLSDLRTYKERFAWLRDFKGNMEKAKGNETARLAHQTIGAIQKARDVEEIETILKRDLGDAHLILMEPAEFAKTYGGKKKRWRKQYTSGFAVYHQKGDAWEVIVNKDAFAKRGNIKSLRNQLIHELLHAEFENHEDTRNRVEGIFMEYPDQWSKVREAYLEAYGKTKKSPHPDGHWDDRDIMSELYAMHDFGKKLNRGNSPQAQLNNLIFRLGLNSKEKISDYQAWKDEHSVEEKVSKVMGAEEAEEEHAEKPAVSHAEGGAAGAGEVGGGGAVEENGIKIGLLQKQIKSLFDAEYLDDVPGARRLLNVMNKFNKETGDINQELKGKTNYVYLYSIERRIKKVGDDLKLIEKALGQVSNDSPNRIINPLQNLWNSTNVFSVEDLVQVCVHVYEFFKRRHERKRDDHAARLGMALFDRTDLGREAKARKLKAESAEVNEWKERLENEDAWKLLELIDKLGDSLDPSADQLKAILRILAQKGRIEWHRPGLWKVLNKLQSKTGLKIGDPVLHHNPSLLKQKLHQAMEAIWDADEYLNLQRDNEHGYEGGKQKYMGPLDGIQDMLTPRLDQLLADFRRGKKVDPQEYEAIIEYAVKKGKSNAENVMFHLIVGQAVGILQPDRGMSLDKFLNEWPATQWIYARKPPLSQHDYLGFCRQYFPKDFENGTISGAGHGAQFKNFYWTIIQNEPMTLQRVRKAVSERKWDHDWIRSIACLGDANTAKRFLWGKSGAQDVQDTAIENAMVGTLQWLEENAQHPERTDWRKEFTRQIGFFAMTDAIGERVAYKSEKAVSQYNASMLGATPREADVGAHADWTTAQHRDEIRKFMDRIDPLLFPLLRDNKRYKDSKEQFQAILDHLKANYSDTMPETIEKLENRGELDGIFDNMDEIMQGVTKKKSDEEFYGVIKSIARKK